MEHTLEEIAEFEKRTLEYFRQQGWEITVSASDYIRAALEIGYTHSQAVKLYCELRKALGKS